MTKMKLSSFYEYKENDGIIEMHGESEYWPFNQYIIGVFFECKDGYYRFEQSREAPMTAKSLREASKKCSLLNS